MCSQLLTLTSPWLVMRIRGSPRDPGEILEAVWQHWTRWLETELSTISSSARLETVCILQYIHYTSTSVVSLLFGLSRGEWLSLGSHPHPPHVVSSLPLLPPHKYFFWFCLIPFPSPATLSRIIDSNRILILFMFCVSEGYSFQAA